MSGVLGMLLGSTAASSSSDAAETTAFLARTSGLDATHINAYKAFINGLVTDSVFSAFDALYILATQDSTTAKLNLISTSFNLTAVNAPTFTADNGYAGNGSSSYLDTGFNASTASTPKLVQDSGHHSVWNLTNATPDGGLIGNSNNGASWLFFSGSNYPRVNDTGPSFTLADPRGHLLANRTNSADRQAYKNASQVNTTTYVTDPVANSNFAICGWSPASGLITNQIAAASIGRGLTGTEITNFYNRLRTFMTAVGVP